MLDVAEPTPWWRRAALTTAEGAIGVGVALVFVAWSRRVDTNPLNQIAQVSALAHLQLQLWVLGAVAIVVALAGLRWAGHRFAHLAEPVACAIVSGVSTSLVAGAILVGLNGTPWGVGGRSHDSNHLAHWATALSDGHSITSPIYPPAYVYALSWLSDVTGQPAYYALKDLQILGTALLGPIAYLAWRMVLRPLWALGAGTVAVLPVLDGYKPAGAIVVAVSIPLFVAVTQAFRRSATLPVPALIGLGVGLGALAGLLLLTHPVYVLWPAPGVAAAVLLLTPWRRARWRAAVLALSGLATLGVVSGPYLYRFLTGVPDVQENYFYFDALQDPAYFLMWRGSSRPTGDWPIPGEVGGVGVFGLLVAVAIGVALALAWKRSLVATVVLCFASVWMFRFYAAARMSALHEVRLWPRTSVILAYCALLLIGAAAFALWRRLGRDRPPAAALGVVVAALLVFGMAGSATASRYLPDGPGKPGSLTWAAQHARLLDGSCPRWVGQSCW
ncbi:hypothetical protein GCM10009539_84410 [Cryptosporangium japonicum]|uniref:Galactan 5-O-arabinofuranosyltransferase n=1 Tax=Cryptosporangium japonicum TaxID=80872 RepID=A0ABP3EXL2_9ACTN